MQKALSQSKEIGLLPQVNAAFIYFRTSNTQHSTCPVCGNILSWEVICYNPQKPWFDGHFANGLLLLNGSFRSIMWMFYINFTSMIPTNSPLKRRYQSFCLRSL